MHGGHRLKCFGHPWLPGMTTDSDSFWPLAPSPALQRNPTIFTVGYLGHGSSTTSWKKALQQSRCEIDAAFPWLTWQPYNLVSLTNMFRYEKDTDTVCQLAWNKKKRPPHFEAAPCATNTSSTFYMNKNSVVLLAHQDETMLKQMQYINTLLLRYVLHTVTKSLFLRYMKSIRNCFETGRVELYVHISSLWPWDEIILGILNSQCMCPTGHT